jgi:hypothetical protein
MTTIEQQLAAALRGFLADKSQRLGHTVETYQQAREALAAFDEAQRVTATEVRAMAHLKARALLPLRVDVDDRFSVHVTSIRDARNRQLATVNAFLEDRAGIAALLVHAVNRMGEGA